MKLIFLLFSIWSLPTFAQNQEFRIISLDPAISEILSSVGLEKYLVGVTQHCNYPESLKSLPQVGSYNSPQLEKILKLKPTHILSLKLGRPLLKRELSQLKISQLQWKASELNDYLVILRDLEKNFSIDTSKQQKTFQLWIQKISKIHHDKKYIAIASPFPLIVAGNHSYLSEAFKLCQMKNLVVHKKSWPQISIETWATLNADYLISLSDAPPPTHPKSPSILKVDIDALSRLSPRLLPEVYRICASGVSGK